MKIFKVITYVLIIYSILLIATIANSRYASHKMAQSLKVTGGKIIFRGSLKAISSTNDAIGIYDCAKDATDIFFVEEFPYCPVIMPDGNKFLYKLYNSFNIFTNSINNGNQKIFIDSNNNERAVSIPSFASDGSKMLYSMSRKDGSDNKVYLINLQNGVKREIYYDIFDKLRIYNETISPDGKKIAFIGDKLDDIKEGIFNHSLYIVDFESGDILNKFPIGPVWYYAWAPDSKRLCYIPFFEKQIHIINYDGLNDKKITKLKFEIWDCSWSPDGTKIIFDYVPWPATTPDKIYIINTDGTGLQEFRPTKGKWSSISEPFWWGK